MITCDVIEICWRLRSQYKFIIFIWGWHFGHLVTFTHNIGIVDILWHLDSQYVVTDIWWHFTQKRCCWHLLTFTLRDDCCWHLVTFTLREDCSWHLVSFALIEDCRCHQKTFTVHGTTLWRPGEIYTLSNILF